MNGYGSTFDLYDQDQIINMVDSAASHAPQQDQPRDQHSAKPSDISLEQTIVSLQTPKTVSIGSIYDQNQTIFVNQTSGYHQPRGADEQPPLLEDIGVDVRLVLDKIASIVRFEKPTQRYIEEPDLFGPTLIAVALGFLLLASGKAHFGDIYALFVMGNLLVCLLCNLMTQKQLTVSLYSTMSVLGYCLLPMLAVGLFGIAFKLANEAGILLSLGLALWCAWSSAGFVQMMMEVPPDRKFLLFYPLYLYYVSFAMITIF